MIFPSRTQVNKIMPKARFMKLAELSTASRNELNENVERLIISNTLREDTLNIKKGTYVSEIDVFEILLRTKNLSDRLIKEIDSLIPKNIIYVLKNENMAQLVVSYKEKSLNSSKYKVIKIYRSEWKNYDDITLDINGLNLDVIFNNLLAQIADTKVNVSENSTIKEAVEQSIDVEKLTRKIEQLQNKIRKEPQFNKQLELKKELKRLTEKLKEVNIN